MKKHVVDDNLLLAKNRVGWRQWLLSASRCDLGGSQNLGPFGQALSEKPFRNTLIKNSQHPFLKTMMLNSLPFENLTCLRADTMLITRVWENVTLTSVDMFWLFNHPAPSKHRLNNLLIPKTQVLGS